MGVLQVAGVGAFQVFRSALVGDAAGDVPHTAANLHGVGGDDFSYFGGKVAQNDFAFIVPTGIEAEGAEVNPGAASHLLVYLELRGAAFVIDGVKGIVRAVWQGLVRDVYGVLSGRRDFGNPFGGACVSFLDGFYSAVSAFLERILKVYVLGAQVGEALSCSLAPELVTGIFCIDGTAGQATVIVYDDFCRLAIAFAGKQHVGTGIFQHRHEERQYVALGVEVFHGLEDTCTLPFPTVEFRLVVPAVALP